MYRVTILADSKDPRGNRLTTFELVFPRIILSQFSKHRMFSFNTSSSRAVPFEKMVKMVQEDPFIPIAWQKPHKGMQGTEYYDHTLKEEVGGLDYTNLPRRWLRARDTAVSMAKIMTDEVMNMPITKQLANRLLEPFMWVKVIMTTSEEGLQNFFELRCPQYVSLDNTTYKSWKDLIEDKENKAPKEWIESAKKYNILEKLQCNKGQAEIHMGALAEAMYDAYNESTPKKLNPGEWHIPFIDRFDSYSSLNTDASAIDLRKDFDMNDIKIATALAARVSYTTIGSDFDIDHERLLKLHDRLVEDRHLSVFEHCARAMSDEEYTSFIKGRSNANWNTDLVTDDTYEISAQFDNTVLGWCNNLKGFIPYRYMIEKGEEL